MDKKTTVKEVAGLVGGEVITNDGTAIPTPSAGRIDWTAGTCWNIRIDGVLLYYCGNRVQKAEALLKSSLALSRRIEDGINSAWLLHDLARIDMNKGDIENASKKLHESLAISERLSLRQASVQALIGLSDIEEQRGNLEKALQMTRKALLASHRMGLTYYIINAAKRFVIIEIAANNHKRAVQIIGALETIYPNINHKRRNKLNTSYEECRKTMKQDAFQTAWTAGSTMSLDQLVDYAFEAK